jgi:hypothetical protein
VLKNRDIAMESDGLSFRQINLETEEDGRALAAAGVLEAAFGDAWAQDVTRLRYRLREVAEQAIAKGEGISFRWVPPRSTGTSGITDTELAAAWRDVLGCLRGSGPSRLLLDLPGTPAAKRADLLGVLSGRLAPARYDMLGRLQAPFLAQRGFGNDWRNLTPDVVGSIGLKVPPRDAVAYAPHRWSWPLRVESQEALQSRAGERGFFVPGKEEPDLLLGVLSPKDSANAGLCIVTATAADAQRLRLPGPLPGARPAVLAPVAPDLLKDFLRGFAYEVAHDAPADIALNWSWLRFGHHQGDAAPLFLVPDAAWFGDMEASRLSARIRELVEDLRRRRDGPDIEPKAGLPGFGLGEVRRIAPAELADHIEAALREGRVRFDNESDVGTDMLTLHEAMRGERLSDPLAGSASDPFAVSLPSFYAPKLSMPAPPLSLPEDYDWLDEALSALEPKTPPAPIPSLPAAEPMPQPAAHEADRYADLNLFHDHHYGAEAPDPARRLGEGEALAAHAAYTLSVAIRREPTGIGAAQATRPVINPRQGRESVELLAVVSCRQPYAPIFEEPVLPLEWPHDADSAPALFRFTTGAAPPPEPLRIEVRLYARASLALLDIVEVVFTAGRWTRHEPEPGPTSPPLGAAWPDALALHVTRENGGYGFEVLFRRAGKEHLRTSLGRQLDEAELRYLLLRVRAHWTRLVIGKLASRPALTVEGYRQELAAIADLGSAAWLVLFGNRLGEGAGASEALGEALRSSPLAPGSPVRITTDRDAQGFVFPWAILCPPHGLNETPDPQAIWGLRYRIELTQKQGPLSPPSSRRPRIAAVLDPGFASSVDHRATLEAVTRNGAAAELLEGNTEEAVLGRLQEDPPADLYYYFCHGFAPGQDGLFKTDVLAEIRKVVEALPAADQLPWTKMLSLAGDETRVAAMLTGAAHITEDRLNQARFFIAGRPLVFLNMCHSADLQPSLRAGLTSVFIARSAAAVLGTECPVTSVFADRFAERVLSLLLEGRDVGEAVLAARQHFHAARNPLGLVYTLYGHAEARLTVPNHPLPGNKHA